jgi:hypothetical protein
MRRVGDLRDGNNAVVGHRLIPAGYSPPLRFRHDCPAWFQASRECSSVTEQTTRPQWLIPLAPAVFIAVCAIAIGYNRDFGVGLIAALLLLAAIPMLLFLGVMLLFALRTADRRWDHWAALGLVVSAPVLCYVTFHVRDRVRFVVWAPFHRELLNHDSDKDGVVTAWDRWGLAGMENDSYLVRHTGDRLSSIDEANAWRQRLGLPCEIVRTQRVWQKLYVVTTYECVFEESPSDVSISP